MGTPVPMVPAPQRRSRYRADGEYLADDETVIWEDSTWPNGCFSFMCCSVTYWTVTN